MIGFHVVRPTFAQIDLDTLKANYLALRDFLASDRPAPPPELIAVVKANAYGHGLVPVAQALEAVGATMLACADIEEGVQLRDAGIRRPILVFGALSISDLSITDGVTGSGSSIAVNINSSNTATSMLSQIEGAIDNVASARGRLGAPMNRLENAVSVMQAQVQNLTAAESQIRDADFAAEIANLTKFQILSQVGVAAMAQANAVPQGVLSLFQ